MADQIQDILEVPTEFARDGIQFMRRCTKRSSSINLLHTLLEPLRSNLYTADQKEFLRLCQAVGIGFLIMFVSPLIKTGYTYMFG
jgi:preprotein translocase subunit Sss1